MMRKSFPTIAILTAFFAMASFTPLSAQKAWSKGILKSIEDAGYPMQIVKIYDKESKKTMEFSVNVEGGDFTMEKLNSLKDKKILFDWGTNSRNNVSAIWLAGVNLLESPPTKGSKSFSGTLTGADAPTGGDLPDQLRVTDKDGNFIDFDYFITENMVKGNNKSVKVDYTIYEFNELLGIDADN